MKKLFIALSLEAPWPETLPNGRIVAPTMRHVTLLFLGQQDEREVLSMMPSLPLCPLILGPSGYFDRCLLLPPDHPRALSWHLELGEHQIPLCVYTKILMQYFTEKSISLSNKSPWLPHVTIARSPFIQEDWVENFQQLPFIITSLNLLKSMENLSYQSLWGVEFIRPFEKLSHTADIAFLVRGVHLRDLYNNAYIALAFEYPSLLSFTTHPTTLESLDTVIMKLNQLVTQMDLTCGSPFKAVSYHGQAKQMGDYLEWEMIVDV